MGKFNKKSFIIQTLRRATYRYPARNEALKSARISRGLYKCALCPKDKPHKRDQVFIDHILPVVDPVKGFTGWDDYIERMFPEQDGFQVICEEHHTKKTEKENSLRKKTKNVKK